MYKYLFLLFTILFNFSNVRGQTSKIIDEALVKAKEENKYVFVNYSSESCELSENFKKRLNNDDCKLLFDKNYIVVNVDVSKEESSSYIKNMSSVKRVFPFWYILDDSGNFIEISINAKGENISCPTTKKSVDDFVRIIEKTSKLSEKELNIIANSFHGANNNLQYYSSK